MSLLFRESVDQMIARMQEEEEIRCPFCDHLQSRDDGQYPINYHGHEDGPEEFPCEACYKEFWVLENVRRTYSVGKTRKEANGEEGDE